MPQRRPIAAALTAFLAFVLVLAPAAARAAAGACTISTAVEFGIFTGSEIDITGTMTITCTGGSGNNNVNIRPDFGTGSTSFTARFLTSGANHLSYQLYTDAAHTSIFGNNSGGSHQITVAINYLGAAQVTVTAAFFAVLPAQAVPPSGTYTSTIAVTLEGGGVSGGANAGSFVVTAIVAPVCTVAASNLDFGVYTPSATTPRTSQATIVAHCSAGQAYMVGLGAGSYPGATTTSRRMVLTGGGGDTLSYGLYSDAAGTVNWGNSFGGGGTQDVVLGTGTGSDQELPVFGRIEPGQYVRAGQYEDTVLVTLEF